MLMKRENGFILLDDYQGQAISTSGHNQVLCFAIDGEDWYFKEAEEANLYKELFCTFICSALDITYVEYYLAKYKGKIGHLSHNYKKMHEKEVTLYDVLIDYYYSYAVELDEYQDLKSFDELYNFHDVLKAFNYRYRSCKGKEAILHRLEKELLDAFLLQIFLGNSDMHYKNLGVLESEEDVRLTPNYDFERAFYVSIDNDLFPYALKWRRSEEKQIPGETILEFMKDTKYQEYFFYKISLLPRMEDIPLDQAYEGQYRFFLHQYQSYLDYLRGYANQIHKI